MQILRHASASFCFSNGRYSQLSILIFDCFMKFSQVGQIFPFIVLLHLIDSLWFCFLINCQIIFILLVALETSSLLVLAYSSSLWMLQFFYSHVYLRSLLRALFSRLFLLMIAWHLVVNYGWVNHARLFVFCMRIKGMIMLCCLPGILYMLLD